jgi:peptide/nickel transport system substrate-binding protein
MKFRRWRTKKTYREIVLFAFQSYDSEKEKNMNKSKWFALFALSLIFMMLFTACQPQATQTTPAETQAPATAVVATVPATAVATTAPATAAATTAPTQAPVSQEKPLIIPAGGDVDTMFPDYSTTAFGSSLAALAYSSLTTVGLDATVIPDLAESWEVSTDQLTWTFHLRKDAKWQDGQPITAADVKFSYEFRADPTYLGGMYSNMTSIAGVVEKNAGTATEISGIKIIDDNTISFTTVQPDALVLDTFASSNMVVYPQHILKDIPIADLASSDFARLPIGSGPYQLTDWKSKESMTFTANPYYYGTQPIIKTIIFKIVPEPSAQITGLLNGEVNMLLGVSTDDLASVTGVPGITTKELADAQYLSLNLNLNDPLFKDVRTRQAMAYAIDRQSLLDALYSGKGKVENSIFFPTLPEYNANIKGYDYDPAKAKQMLAEVGWTDTSGDGILEAKNVAGVADGTKFEFTLLSTTTPFYAQENQVIQQQLLQVGIKTDISQQEFSTYFTIYVAGGKWQATGIGWYNLIGTPQMELGWNFMCPADKNTYGYCNPDLDAMINKNNTLFDVQKRLDNFKAIQEIIHEAAVVIPLIRGNSIIAFQDTLVTPGFKTSIDAYRTMSTWYWK